MLQWIMFIVFHNIYNHTLFNGLQGHSIFTTRLYGHSSTSLRDWCPLNITIATNQVCVELVSRVGNVRRKLESTVQWDQFLTTNFVNSCNVYTVYLIYIVDLSLIYLWSLHDPYMIYIWPVWPCMYQLSIHMCIHRYIDLRQGFSKTSCLCLIGHV